MKKLTWSVLLLLLIGCGKNQKKELAAGIDNQSDYAVEVHMEGDVFRIAQKNLVALKKKVFTNDTIRLVLWEDGNPFQVNINFTHADILQKGSATFTIPEVNDPRTKVELNFFNADRDTDQKMNKRILFRKGTITVKQLTAQQLQMSFKGEGAGMMERTENFAISGELNVKLE